MRIKLFFVVTLIIGLGIATIFSSCSEAKSSEKAEAKQEMDNDLDKYVGVYYGYGTYYSINKFPINSVVHTETGDVYLPLDKKFIGKYYLVEDVKQGAYYDTTNIKSFAGGFIAPPTGVIILGVDKNSGKAEIQNFNNYGISAEGNKTMIFNVQEGVYGNCRFEKGENDKNDLIRGDTKLTFQRR